MKTNTITFCLFFLTLTAFSQNITGAWNGAIELDEDKKIHFIFNIAEDGTKYQTTIDIPLQRVIGIKAINTLINNDSLVFDLSNVGMKYNGKLNDDHTL
jgi:hypothetical protein